MKRSISVYVLIMLLLFSMSGCSNNMKQKKEEDINKSKEQKKLVVYSMSDNPTIRTAIMGYKTYHRNVSIDYEIAMQDSSGGEESDLIHLLNTRILAGDGPDIIVLDKLPVSSYIKKGALMDMSDIFMDMYKNEEILTNIADNYISDNQLYCMPLRFYVPLYLMTKDLSDQTKSLQDLATYCKKSEKGLMEHTTYERITKLFLYTYWNELIDDNGTIDKEKFKDFLVNLSEIAKRAESSETISDDESADSFYAEDKNWNLIFSPIPSKILEESIDLSLGYASDFISWNAFSINSIQKRDKN